MKEILSQVFDNDTIRFASYRPGGAKTVLLERKIRITDPGSLVLLIENEKLSLLPALIELLKDPAKAWAAEVVLTAITGSDGKIIESFEGNTEKWWETVGVNVYEKWMAWYDRHKDDLEWNEEKMGIEMKKQ